MGVQIIGNGGVVIGAGEEARKPLHVVGMPRSGNHYRVSVGTGTITAAMAAGSEHFQFRFVESTKTYALIHRVSVDGIAIVAAATAAGPLGYELVPARNWTVAGSGGTRISPASNNLKAETPLNTSQVSDIGVSTTALLTVGTKTKDTNGQGSTLISVGTGAITTYSALDLGKATLLDDSNGDMPLVLANNEGFVIQTTHVGPATLTYAARFSVAWSEVTAF